MTGYSRAEIVLLACVACGRSELFDALERGGAGSGAQGERAALGGAPSAGAFGMAGHGAGGHPTNDGGLGGRQAMGGRQAIGGRQAMGGRGTLGGRGGMAGTGGVFAGAGGVQAGAGGVAGALPSHCGDGVVDPGEECDDGELDNQDACTASCKQARCGDGFLWRGQETCDDGNTLSGDGCSPSCRYEAREISAGTATSCALGNSVVKCWGNGATGALGRGNGESVGDEAGELGDALGPIDLNGDLNVFAIAAGGHHTCAASLEGVRCWGYNADGELGLGDTENRGDDPGEMGSALPFVNLGANFYPTAIAAGFGAACAVSTYATVKCWGSNLSGELGLGDTANRGDGPGEMGDALPFVALGAAAMIVSVTLGDAHACALFATGQVKCWGANDFGQLGLGDVNARGDEPGEMGDALPFVELGGGESANKLLAAGRRTCALLESGKLKCWGENSRGQLGLGDAVDRGTSPGQMGDALPAVALGTNRSVNDFALGGAHTCVALDNGVVKCWGSNNAGQLGAPGALERGSAPGDMGDSLPSTELDGVVWRIAAGGQHTCVKLYPDARLKCWGDNSSGELGLGDTVNRGDDPNEMGPNLAAVDVSF